MADAGNEDLQCQQPEEHQEDETGNEDVSAPTEMYLPDLDNIPLSQALKNRPWSGNGRWSHGGVSKAEAILRGRHSSSPENLRMSPPTHQGWGRDISHQLLKTKFPIPLLKKALEGAEQQRATPKDLPGEDWPWKIKTIRRRMELDSRLDAYAELLSRYARNSSLSRNMHTWWAEAQQMGTTK